MTFTRRSFLGIKAFEKLLHDGSHTSETWPKSDYPFFAEHWEKLRQFRQYHNLKTRSGIFKRLINLLLQTQQDTSILPVFDFDLSRRGFLGAALTTAVEGPSIVKQLFFPYVAREHDTDNWETLKNVFISSSTELLSGISGREVNIDINALEEMNDLREQKRILGGLYLGWKMQKDALDVLKLQNSEAYVSDTNPLQIADSIIIKTVDSGDYARTDHEIADDGTTTTTISFANYEPSSYRAFAAIHESIHSTEDTKVQNLGEEAGYNNFLVGTIREAHATISVAQILKYMNQNFEEIKSDYLCQGALDALESMDPERQYIKSGNYREYITNGCSMADIAYIACNNSEVVQSSAYGNLRMHTQAKIAGEVDAFEADGLIADVLAHRANFLYNTKLPADSNFTRTANIINGMIGNEIPGISYSLQPMSDYECVTAVGSIALQDNVYLEHITFNNEGKSAQMLIKLRSAYYSQPSGSIWANSIGEISDGVFAYPALHFAEPIRLGYPCSVTLHDSDGRNIYTLPFAEIVN